MQFFLWKPLGVFKDHANESEVYINSFSIDTTEEELEDDAKKVVRS